MNWPKQKSRNINPSTINNSKVLLLKINTVRPTNKISQRNLTYIEIDWPVEYTSRYLFAASETKKTIIANNT
ncbi:MAG: hypothetical protein Tsb004_22860 [Allomuricauda sp.]